MKKELSEKFVKIGQAAQILGVSIKTLRRWEASGKLESIRTPGGTRYYTLNSFKKINPALAEDLKIQALTTEELLKTVQNTQKTQVTGLSEYQTFRQSDKSDLSGILSPSEFSGKKSFITKFLITSFTTLPSNVKKSFLSFILLITLITTLSVAAQSPLLQKALPFMSKDSNPIKTDSNVLAETTALKFLEVNTPVQINDTLDVKGGINGLVVVASPSASTLALTSGNTTFNVTNDSTINQNLSSTSSPTFSALNLSATSNQIAFQSGGPTGTLTWTPTSARTITLPDKTGEVSLLGQTISNSELDNSKVTVSSGTNLTGGGDVSLGSSITLSLKDSISLSGTLAVTGATTLTGAATLGSTLAVTGATTLTSTSLSIGGLSYTFPSSRGSSSTVLTEDGAGTLSWGSLSTAGGWSDDGTVIRLTTITDNVGIGTTTANSKLSIAGSAHIGSLRQGFSSPTDGLFVDGNVGIGATTSSNNLNVWGSARITGSLTLDGSCTGCGGITGGANGQVTFYTGATSSSGSNALFWNNPLNRLGVGSSAPGSTLGVFGNLGIGSSYGYYTAPANGLAIEGNVGIATTTANSTLSIAGSAHIGSLRQGFSSPTDGLFVDGNVGIGATTSTNLLDVWGSSRITGNLTIDGSCTGCGGLSGGSNGAVTYWSGTNTVAANTAFFWNNPLNRLGIGSSAPGSTLGIFGSVGIGASYGYGILPSNLNNGLAVEGNVGVGKSTTAFNLDVAGSAGVGTSLTVTSLTNTTGLNVSGTSVLGTGYVSTLTVSGNTGVGGSLTTTSLDYASGGLRVNGFSDLTGNLGVGLSLTATGTNAVIAGTNLNITGISNLAGNLGVGTSLSVSGTNGLTNTRNLRVSGTADINTLYVSSCSGCGGLSGGSNGAVTYWSGTNTVAANTAFFWNNPLNRLGIGSSAPGSTLGIFGSVGIGASYGYGILPSNLNNGLAIEGNVGIGKSTSLFNLDVAGSVGVGTSLTVTSLTNTTGLNVSGTSVLGSAFASSLTVSGNTGIGASISVTGLTYSLGGLRVNGFSDLTGNLGVGSSAIINGNIYTPLGLKVGGFSDLAGNVGVGSSLNVVASSGLINTRNLNVSGTSVLETGYASGLTVVGNVGVGLSLTATGTNAVIAGTNLNITGISNLVGNLGVGTSLTVTATNGLTNTRNLRVLGTADINTLFVTSCTGCGGGVSGSGANGQLTFWTSSSAVSGNNALFWDNPAMRLGIGSSAPGSTLGVFGSVGVGTSYGFATLPANLNNGLAIQGNVGIGYSTAGGALVVNGNIGIGSTSPSAPLSFNSTSQTPAANIVNQVNAISAGTTGTYSSTSAMPTYYGNSGIGNSGNIKMSMTGTTTAGTSSNIVSNTGSVTLNFTVIGTTPTIMKITNDLAQEDDCNNLGLGSFPTTWQTFATSVSWTLATDTNNNLRRVCARFALGTNKNPGAIIDNVSATICVNSTDSNKCLEPAAPAIVSSSGYLFITGGIRSGFTSSQSSVYSAQIKADGTIGSYSTLTYLPENLRAVAATTYNGYLFVVGGIFPTTNPLLRSTVYSAPINSDGTIGTFSTLTYLPTIRAGHTAEAYNGYLFVLGGQADAAGTSIQSTVYSAPINSDGTIGSFSTLTYLPQGLNGFSSTISSNYLFVTGGYSSAGQSTVYSAPINSNGTIGAFSTLTYLPKALVWHTTNAYNGYLYVTGGYDPVAGTNQSAVYSAPINSDGTIGAFSTLTYLPVSLTAHRSHITNGYLFAEGGFDNTGDAFTTIYTTPLKSSGLAINTHGSFASGNLLDLWNNLSSKFSVDYSGNVISALGSKWMPLSDSTTALNIADSQGTSFVKFDSSTQRVGIGVGTSAPTVTLQVLGNVGIGVTGTYTVPVNGLLVGGSVGIGTTSPHPTYKLDVLGAVRATGGFNGTCRTDGTTTNGPLCNQDVAEIYPASEDVEAGDLLVIDNDSHADKSVKKSNSSYDNHIIGIVSSSPGLILGLNGSDVYLGGESSAYSQKEEAKRQPAVALAGKVPLKVSTENGPINVGDYLTSSSTPGVAMKALRPGQVVGKALESFDGNTSEVKKCDYTSEVKCGKILAFVNISYADPNNFFASLSFDSEGNLVIPKIKTGTLTLDSSIASASASLSVIPADAGIHLTTSSSEMDPRLRGDDGKVFYDLTGKIASLEERISKLEASIPEQPGTTQIASDSATPVASDSATLASNYTLELTPPDTLLASSSASLTNPATFSDAEIAGKLTAYQTEISDYLKVFGETTLAKTNVAGDLTVDGTLSIENGSEINVIGAACHPGLDPGSINNSCGTLYLQRSSLAQGLDILAGKIVIDKDGNIKTTGDVAAVSISTNKLTISNSTASIGSGKIPSGKVSVTIATSEIDNNSKVFIAARSKIGIQALTVSAVEESKNFTVSLDHPLPEDVGFDWWIVGTN